jgi:hypothetical protein
MLSHPDRDWQVQELAAEAQVSLGLASKTVKSLLQQAFVAQRGRRTLLLDPAGLLRAWMSSYAPAFEEIRLYVMGKPAEVEERLAAECNSRHVRYGLTQFSGAWRLGPAVRYVQSTAYVEARDNVVTSDLVKAIPAKRVEAGSNLLLLVTRDSSVFYDCRVRGGITVVAPIQLYLDLMSMGGRGEEAAQEIMTREIAPGFEAVSKLRKRDKLA